MGTKPIDQTKKGTKGGLVCGRNDDELFAGYLPPKRLPPSLTTS